MVVKRALGASLLALAVALLPITNADAAEAKLSRATTVGLHNAYDKTEFTYLAQALDTGTSMVELDVWDDLLSHQWRVSHSNPLGNDNNCVAATSSAGLYTGNRNQNLASCLADIRWWLSAHPTAGPIYVKLEFKAGFSNNNGMGPDELDTYIAASVDRQHLFRPADLLGASYSTLDAAVRADAWPDRAALAGKMIVYAIPGTVELGNPTDTLHTDVEYATYLKNLSATGAVANANLFPAVLGATTGDPRAQYADTTIRPWFVFFDGDASAYVSSVDTSWYATNHYALVMTDAHAVAPALSSTTPSVADAQARVTALAADHASVVSCDWYALAPVLSMVVPRG